MRRYTRRRALLATGTIGAVALAGCVESEGTDDGTPGDDGTDDGDADDVAVETLAAGVDLGRPLWHVSHDEGPTGYLNLFEERREARWLLTGDDGDEDVEAFVEATDFEASVLVFVQTAGPNTCYSDLDVDGVGVEDDEIVGSAVARDTSDGAEACGQAVTFPTALVRVTGDPLPDDAVFDVENGWGEREPVRASDPLVDPENLPGTVRPSGDPETVPAGLACEDGEFERLPGQVAEPTHGETHDEEGRPVFAMRVLDPGRGSFDAADDGATVERGETVEIRMLNVSNRMALTGNRNKFGLEVYTEDGWQDVRGTTGDEPIGYTDEGLEHPPGEGFEWTFEMTEDGVLEGHAHEDRLEVCPDLQAGRYRFVFRDLAGADGLAVEFDYLD